MKCTCWHQIIIITMVKFLLHLALSRGDRRLVWWSWTLDGDPALIILWKWLFLPHLYSIGDVLWPLRILSKTWRRWKMSVDCLITLVDR